MTLLHAAGRFSGKVFDEPLTLRRPTVADIGAHPCARHDVKTQASFLNSYANDLRKMLNDIDTPDARDDPMTTPTVYKSLGSVVLDDNELVTALATILAHASERNGRNGPGGACL